MISYCCDINVHAPKHNLINFSIVHITIFHMHFILVLILFHVTDLGKIGASAHYLNSVIISHKV